MTLSEFKAWFEGYTEGLEAAPTKAQFDRIKEKVKEINGAPITQTVFLDHYRRWYPYYDHYGSGGTYTSYNNAVSGNLKASAQGVGNNQLSSTFDSAMASYTLGKAEAAN